MADGLAFLSLACNILQLVEFSGKLFVETRAIYKSASDLPPSYTTLDMIANDTRALCGKIALQPGATAELTSIVQKCEGVGKDLLEALSKLKTKANKTKWGSFVLALKEALKDDEIRELQQKLAMIQMQLSYHMQHSLVAGQNKLSQSLSDVQNESSKLNTKVEQFQRALEEQLQPGFKDVESKIDHLREDIRFSQEMISALGRLNTALDNGRRILRSLYFPLLEKRHRDVRSAHAKTFTWTLNPTNKDRRFVDWLAQGSGPFWIQGKPGSGKSTLMKFLCGDDKTRELLQNWAGDARLVVAKYFFWNAGNQIQKSQEGLLRSLLFEVLRQCPDLIDTVIGDVDLDDPGFPAFDPWPLSELLLIFERLMKHSTFVNGVHKVCFFIDGLDEFDGPPETLIKILDTMSGRENIKLCVSSRPWTQFWDKYGHDASHKLDLEDFTENDIMKYVMDTFENNEQFQGSARKNPKFRDIISQIPKRAHGVFLWVYLVVNTLLEGLTHRDRPSDFQRRLDSFPKDLESFFQKMLRSTLEVYRTQTVRNFKVALAAEEALDLILYSFMDEIEDDPSWVSRLEVKPCSKEEIEERHEDMRPRIDARCKGLLEIRKASWIKGEVSFKQYNVEFLHRTARDFLMESKEVESLFSQYLDSDFDPLLILCESFVAAIKLARMDKPSPEDPWRSKEELIDLISSLVYYTAKGMSTARGTSEKVKEQISIALVDVSESLSNSASHDPQYKKANEIFQARMQVLDRLGFSLNPSTLAI